MTELTRRRALLCLAAARLSAGEFEVPHGAAEDTRYSFRAINPATGCPYAMSFPVITIRDMARLQKMLIDHLGIDVCSA